MSDMRLLLVLTFGALICSAASAQNALPDNIDMSRTIIAKLDRAMQNDPSPNLSASSLVKLHKDATDFIETADLSSGELRKGEPVDATNMFALYTRFMDLYAQYDLFEQLAPSTRHSEVMTALTGTAKDYYDTKLILEAGIWLKLQSIEEALKACQARKAR